VLRPGGVLAAVTWGDDYPELELLRAAFGPVPDAATTDADDARHRLADCAAAYADGDGRVVLDWQFLVMSTER